MNTIRQLMRDKGVRFTDIREKTGLSQCTLTRVLQKSGVPDSTKLGTLKKISSVLGVDVVSALIGFDVTYDEILDVYAKKEANLLKKRLKDNIKRNL